MSDIAIRVENVSKFYKLYNSSGDRLKEALNPFGKVYHKEFYALNNIDLVVKKGEILGVVGKNGCGKSTLLKLITGVLTPSEGKVYVDGKVSALLELGAGFNPEFTGMQNIFFYGAILGLSKDEINKKLDEILAFADIGDFIYQPIKLYSSGMKSRLGFSVAAHIDPDILILDEVLAVGDIRFQRKCYKFIEGIKAKGRTILFVSHSLNAINSLCDKVAILDGGCLYALGETREMVNLYSSIMFGGESEKKNNSLQTSDNEHRTGSKRAEINKYELIDGSSEIAACIISTEKYTFVMNVVFNDAVEDPVFGILIKTVQGLVVFGTNTHHAGYGGKKYMKGDTETIYFDVVMNLASGKYFVSYTVGDFEDMYDARLDAQLVEVVGKSQQFPNSIADLSPEIHIKSTQR